MPYRKANAACVDVVGVNIRSRSVSKCGRSSECTGVDPVLMTELEISTHRRRMNEDMFAGISVNAGPLQRHSGSDSVLL